MKSNPLWVISIRKKIGYKATRFSCLLQPINSELLIENYTYIDTENSTIHLMIA